MPDRGSSVSLIILSAFKYSNRLYQTLIDLYIDLILLMASSGLLVVAFLADFLVLVVKTSGFITPLIR
jgi:hypothetical protein